MPNPLAREIVDACQGLGLDTVFEPGKTHPKDWANPGRVRVGLRRSRIRNSEFAGLLYVKGRGGGGGDLE